MSYTDQANQYYELVRQGMPAAQAYAQAFPNGAPTEEDYLRDQAKKQQSSAVGAIGGVVGGALGVKAVSDAVTGSGWFAPEVVKETGQQVIQQTGQQVAQEAASQVGQQVVANTASQVGSQVAADAAANAAYNAAADVATQEVASQVGSQLGQGAIESFGNYVGPSSGPGGLPVGQMPWYGPAAAALAVRTAPIWMPPLLHAGSNVLGWENGNARPMTAEEIQASSGNLERFMPGFSQLSPDQQRTIVGQLTDAGLMNAVTKEAEGAPLENFAADNRWHGAQPSPMDPHTWFNLGFFSDMGGKAINDRIVQATGHQMPGFTGGMALGNGPQSMSLHDQNLITQQYGSQEAQGKAFLAEALMNKYFPQQQQGMAQPMQQQGGGFGGMAGRSPQQIDPGYNNPAQMAGQAAGQYMGQQQMTPMQRGGFQPSMGQAMGSGMQMMGAQPPQLDQAHQVGQQIAAALMGPARSNTRSPGIDKNGNRIRY